MVGALSYGFSVPDEEQARLLASALADFGFPQVSANPARTRGWRVWVVDDCRQYEEPHEDRQREAVKRQATAIARQHRGYASGPTVYHPSRQPPSLASSTPRILLLNPDRHPPVPVVQSAPAPPPGPLSLEPDLPVLSPPDLARLRAVAWDELDHAYLPDSLPGLISDLVLGRVEWDLLFSSLMPALIHQGTLYAATGPALTVLGRLAAEESLEAGKRLDVYILLFKAAGHLRADLVADADRAHAEDRQPRPQRWAAPVRQAVQAITPELLARWDTEPPACRMALAVLAAEFPEHGAAVAGEIAAAADEYRGTRTGELFTLAQHLIGGDTTRALATASAIACWSEDLRADWIDDDSIAPGPRAIQVLAETASAAAYHASLA